MTDVAAVDVRSAEATDVDALAVLAALTFPLAAPDDAAAESLAEFIELHLSTARFHDYLADPDHDVRIAAATDGRLVGYTLTHRGEPDDPDVRAVVTERPVAYLSKCYVHPDAQGSGLATRLIEDVCSRAAEHGDVAVWLGVNEENLRAHRFYEKSGFVRVGTKRFQVGARLEHDFVYLRRLSPPGP